MENPKQHIMAFLGRFFRCETLNGDDDIFAAGFVNSLVIVQLISFLENSFSITIEDEDLELSNFRSVNNILALIERKTAAKSQPNGYERLASAVDAN
ncbi:MAG TPA: phosphopantetheine-binding protein [Candidatus Angelobacter sp.]